MSDNKQQNDSRYVHICAPARLHLGFLDLHGGLNRKFGSLGLSVSNIYTSLTATYADDISLIGINNQRAIDYAEQMLSHYGINGGLCMNINSAIPEHAGLGSGTQLSLVIAAAIAALYDIDDPVENYAAILHRGARSGIGIGTFKHGGFIVDGGRGENTVVPPVVAHSSMPQHWRILLIFDEAAEGMNGVPERRAFNTLPPMDEYASGLLCRLTMMQVLPALNEEDCERFGHAITEIQTIVGDYFAQAQGGRFTSPFMQYILNDLHSFGSTGTGQSSWGPTGFAFFPNETTAFQAMKQIRENWQHETSIKFSISEPMNEPALINVSNSSEQKSIDMENKIKTI